MERAAEPQADAAINLRTVTRAALLDAVYASGLGLSRVQAREIVEMALEEISVTLVRGECVNLRSFGLFAVRAKRERIGRNPRTGVEAPINSRRVVTFKPSPVLSACVNGAAPDEESWLNRAAGSAKRADDARPERRQRSLTSRAFSHLNESSGIPKSAPQARAAPAEASPTTPAIGASTRTPDLR